VAVFAAFPLRCRKLDGFWHCCRATAKPRGNMADAHDHRVQGRAWTRTGRKRPSAPRHRDSPQELSRPRVRGLLRRHNVALVFADAVDWPYAEDVTADFLYLRLHGSEEL
jgi:uncharacterized protein YecE (DUF72 family)